MKILFMGTPDIAAASLETIIHAGHTLCGVFTREDKPVGRKHVLTAPPVKIMAQQHGIPVFQPKTLRNEESLKLIETLAPDLIIVVAYGRILPPEILAVPPLGCINLHVSLLPKYRGAAPVQWAILNGDTATGVTIMYLKEGIDTGDILRVAPVSIGENETAGELFVRITAQGAQTLLATLQDLENGGRIIGAPQNEAEVTYAPILNKEMGLFCFDAPAEKLHNLVRGLNPWPTAYFVHDGKNIKVLRTLLDRQASGKSGEILSVKPLKIACKTGALTLLEIVPEGKNTMDGAAWAAGKHFALGATI